MPSSVVINALLSRAQSTSAIFLWPRINFLNRHRKPGLPPATPCHDWPKETFFFSTHFPGPVTFPVMNTKFCSARQIETSGEAVLFSDQRIGIVIQYVLLLDDGPCKRISLSMENGL